MFFISAGWLISHKGDGYERTLLDLRIPDENDSMTETDIIIRQKELMELIEEEEFIILNTQ